MKKLITSLIFSFLILPSLLFSASPVTAQQGCFKRESLRLNSLTAETSPRDGQRFLVEVKGLVNDASVQYAVRYFKATGPRPEVRTDGQNAASIFYPDKYPDWELDLKNGLPAGKYKFELLRAGKIGPVTGNFEDICATLPVTVNNADGSSPVGSEPSNFKLSTCSNGSQGVETALGCVKGDLQSFVNLLFNLALGLAGGLAVLFIIIGGFKVAMSQGDIEALQDGRDLITKAITGLAFILLASTILAIIGIDILGLNSVFQRGPGGSVIVK